VEFARAFLFFGCICGGGSVGLEILEDRHIRCFTSLLLTKNVQWSNVRMYPICGAYSPSEKRRLVQINEKGLLNEEMEISGGVRPRIFLRMLQPASMGYNLPCNPYSLRSSISEHIFASWPIFFS
jgi:hypothetical protein